MAYCLMSQDILGVCLLVAGGDLNMPLEDIINHIEEFEEQEKRLFGTVGWDFRVLFFWLVWWKIGDKSKNASEYFKTLLGKANLQDVALDVLRWEEAGFSDGDVCWLGYEREPTYEYWNYNYTVEEFNTKQAVRKEMIEFFQGLKGKNCPVRQVQEMLFRLGFIRDTLYECSR